MRPWKDSDIEPFAKLNSDPVVMEHFPKMLTYDESASMVERLRARYESDGFCLWATEEIDTGNFIGFVGLACPNFEASFTPCVEIGWRLAKEYWGKGYAPEAAEASLRDGFERCNLEEIIAITATSNLKSMRVMEKIRMKRDCENDFLHPNIADGHPLKPHVLYRISKIDWKQSQNKTD